MGMHNYSNSGHLLEFNAENMEKFGLSHETEAVSRLIEEEGDFRIAEAEDDPIIKLFISAFSEKWGVTPTFVYLDDEVDGCCGEAEPEKLYLYFCDEDKYVQVVRSEWDNLPIKPKESSWTIYC